MNVADQMKTTIFLATPHGLSVITGWDQSWQGAVRLLGKQIQCVAADPIRKGLVYCGTFGDGLFLSADKGATWNASPGFPQSKVTALTVSPSGTVFAGTELSAVFRSDDAGATWRQLPSLLTLPSAKTWSFPPRPSTHHVQSILPSLVQPDRLHVAVEAGALLRSEDGETWRDRLPGGPKDTHSLAVHPQNPGCLHSAAGDGYFESEDDGASWRRVSDGLEHQYCWSITVGAADPSTLLLSASKSAYAAHYERSAESFLYRRTQHQPWHQVKDGLPKAPGSRISVLGASRVEPGVFYLSAEHEVYRSADGGLDWHRLDIQWESQIVTEHPVSFAILEESSDNDSAGISGV